MEDLEKQDPYRIEMMRTLWENNFRGTIFDYRDSYVATVRLIFSIPLDREEAQKRNKKKCRGAVKSAFS